MRPALVDNLTLNAVQRLLGQVVAEYYSEDEEMIAEDIIAFDNLLNAILFSDQVIYIEGFMPQEDDAERFGEYFPGFKQYRMGLVAYRTIIKDINDEFALKYDDDIENTPAFFAFEFMKPHIQLPAVNRPEYGTLVYHNISANLGADLVLFPTRATFQKRLLKDFTKELSRNRFTEPVFKTTNQPFFINWFAEKYKEPGKFIDAAFKLSEEAEFAEIRSVLDQLKESCETNNPGTVFKRNLALKEFERKMEALTEKYSVKTDSTDGAVGKGGRDGEEGGKIIPLKRRTTRAFNLKTINQGFVPAPGLKGEWNTGTKSKGDGGKEEEMGYPELSLCRPLPREEHSVFLGNMEWDMRQLRKFGMLYDYITADLIFPDSAEAKVFNQARLLKSLRDKRKEGKMIFEKAVKLPIDPSSLINHSDITLSSKTIEVLQSMKNS